MSWETVRLGDICSTISDGDHQAPPKTDAGIPFVTISNITSQNQLDFTNTMFVPKAYYECLDVKRRAQKGDILYSVVGSFGIPVFMRNDAEFVFQRHIAILRPNTKKIVPAYLYYVMLSRDFYMMADAVAIGAAQRTVTLTALRNIEIAVPTMDKQEKIAGTLSAYDNLIDNNHRQITLLEEAAQRLYKEWVVDLRFPGYENTRIVDGVPEGWGVQSLSKVFDYVRGKSYTSKELVEKGGTLMVNLKNIKPYGGYKQKAEKHYIGTYRGEQTLKSGDVVMGVTDMTQERRLVGHVAMIPDLGETITFSMDLIKLIPKSVPHGFLYAMMRFGGYSEKISPIANGVNVLHLKPESIMNLKMLVPVSEIMEQYQEVFELYQGKIEILQKQCDITMEARDRLLPKLMSGEIAV
jgi:restriction modification system DNA specificity domain protein